MNRSLLLLAAAALLYAGCNSDPAAKPPETGTAGASGGGVPKTLAIVSEGGKVKLSGENTRIEFTGTKPNGKHDGTFKSLTGEIQWKTMGPGQQIPPEERVAFSDLWVDIDADSLEADDPGLTKHLKGDDFFKVKQNPKITFRSTKVITKTEDPNDVLVTGDLKIAGTTKSITFPVKVEKDRGQVYLTGRFKVNRKEIGITYEPRQGKIDDEVDVRVTVGTPLKKE